MSHSERDHVGQVSMARVVCGFEHCQALYFAASGGTPLVSYVGFKST